MLSGEREIVFKKLQFKLKGVIVSYSVDTSQLGMEKLASKSTWSLMKTVLESIKQR